MKPFIPKSIIEWYKKDLTFKSFGLIRRILFTFLPNISFYYGIAKKINSEIDIIHYYQVNLGTFLFLLLIGIVISTLITMYRKQIVIEKEITKAIFDHSIRLSLYKSIIHWILENKADQITFADINTITGEEKKYLGFEDDEIKSENKFHLPNISPPLSVDKAKAWKLLKDDYNEKNKAIL